MRNIFLFLRRFSTFIFFLLLQVICIYLLVSYNKSQQAQYLQYAYEVTGRINSKYSGVVNYFKLKSVNKELSDEVNVLANNLLTNYTYFDSTTNQVRDTVKVDTNLLVRKFLWRNANVINNTVAFENNYITLERGRNQGVKPQMAVVGPSGIIGIITDVSNNMSVAMSLLHSKSTVSVSHKNTGNNGMLFWNGKTPALLQIKDIPKSSKLNVGDSILTSNLTGTYPPGLMVGTIVAFKLDPSASSYNVDIKPSSNFNNLQHAFIVENLFLNEQKELEKRSTIKNN
ncbi:rod shape-determining protein MreC [Polluticaenibacter yanchengensis]|uniref:Cell shape-determining protein MreC n=1 Tax=Polluticaenibacter yanchengensis TaxID=3014562 RepID=A0ABT4UKK9_9BACT|nr:rod shape-determining protein MreC [Chitinophagaceae bacterium LY-5]